MPYIVIMANDSNLNENIVYKFCKKILQAGTEQLGSHKEKRRYAAYM